MTFIEVLVAAVVLALTAEVMLVIFGYALNHTKKVENLLSSTFVAQSWLDELQDVDAATAFEEGRGERRQFMDKYVETVVKPYLQDDCHAFYVILGGTFADVYAVPPDNGGALRIPAITGSKSISISIYGSSYSIASSGYKTLEGSLPQDAKEVIVLINGVTYSSSANVTVNVSAEGRAVKVWVYDAGSNSSSIEVNGSNVQLERFSWYTYRDYSSVKAQIKVYEKEDDLEPSASFSSVLQLKN